MEYHISNLINYWKKKLLEYHECKLLEYLSCGKTLMNYGKN